MIDEDRLYQTIGKRLRDLRTDVGLSQEAMAKVLGLERTSITNMELGKQRPSMYTLYRCCEYFERSLADLFPELEESSIAKPKLPPEAARALEKIRAERR